MGSKKIGKGGKGKYGAGYSGEGEIVSIDLEKETAVNLFLALAQALHYPTVKKGKKGKKAGKGKKGGKGTKGGKGGKGTKGGKGGKGAKGSKGAKGY
jgi:hypothetical protein